MVTARLADPRLPLVAAALGTLLVLPAAALGFFQDDLTLRAFARGEAPAAFGPRAPWDLFRFYDRPEVVRAMREQGLAPWWTDDGLRLSFFRPLSSLWHWLDFRLAPELPAVHHLEAVLLYGLVAWTVARFYRQLEPDPRIAGLAGLLWAVDDAHGMPVAWISNRNAVLAWLFAVLAIALHDRWRRLGWRAGAVLAPAAAALGLLAGETALAAWAFVLAHALFLDPGPPRARLLALLPYGALLVAWRVVYRLGGYGASGSAFYVDPAEDPVAFLAALPARVGAVLGALVGPIPADLAMVLPAEARGALFAALSLVALAVAFAARGAVRADPIARFHALGALLACVPVAATLPSDRLVALAGLGAMPLLARLALASRRGAVAVVAVHLALAAPLLPLRALAIALPDAGQRLGGETLPVAPEVVVVSAPDWFVPVFGFQHRVAAGDPAPDALRLLATTIEPLTVARPDPRAVVLRSERGFLRDALAAVPRRDPLRPGDLLAVGGWEIAVEATDGRGHPTALRFTAPTALEERPWVTWRTGAGFAPFTLPAVGEERTLPGAPP